MDSDWTADALFSPSKARAQQARAKGWAAVDSWLVSRYGSRIPNFERNEETLQALLALANLNESADERRGQVEKIEKTAFQALSKPHGIISDEVMHAMDLELVNETHMDTLAETLIALDCIEPNVSHVGKRIIDLSSAEFEINQQLKRTEAQQAALKVEQSHVAGILKELRSDSFQPPVDVTENTAEWTKSTKQLKAKVAEYEERLSASRPGSATGGIELLQQKAQDVARQRSQLANLDAELRAFQDLPTDSRAARRKLEEAREQLRNLTSKRERLFESLAET